MRLQKSKREQAVEHCDKIKILNMELMANDEKIKEKEKELKAKVVWASCGLSWTCTKKTDQN